MRNFINQYLFLSLITVGLGIVMIDLVADAIDGQITMQLEQLENLRNDR